MLVAQLFYALPIFSYCYRIGHQNLVWTEARVCDLLRGLIDNLKLASTFNLQILHQLTLHRLLREYSPQISFWSQVQRSSSVLQLLTQADQVVRKDWVKCHRYKRKFRAVSGLSSR